jgi:hypothetical protein
MLPSLREAAPTTSLREHIQDERDRKSNQGKAIATIEQQTPRLPKEIGELGLLDFYLGDCCD